MSNNISTPGKNGLLVSLQEAQKKHGCIPADLMAELAQSFGLPLSDVYGVASFYSFLSTKPLGRNVIKVCKSLPCYLKNGQQIVDIIEKEIGIKPGGTTSDGRFSLQLTNCMGLCDQAPAMMINDDAHGDLNPQKIRDILGGYK